MTAGCCSQMAQKFMRKINNHNKFWIGRRKDKVVWLFLVKITGTSLIWQQNHPFQERCAKKETHWKWFSTNPFIILSMLNWNVLFILNHFSNENLRSSVPFKTPLTLFGMDSWRFFFLSFLIEIEERSLRIINQTPKTNTTRNHLFWLTVQTMPTE